MCLQLQVVVRRDAARMVQEAGERPDVLVGQETAPGRHGGPRNSDLDLRVDIDRSVSPTGGQKVRRRRRQPLDGGRDAWSSMTLDAIFPKQMRSSPHRNR